MNIIIRIVLYPIIGLGIISALLLVAISIYAIARSNNNGYNPFH